MSKPEEYRAGYLRRMSRHLFNLRDRRGEKHEFLDELVRMLHRALGGEDSFVGVVPVGSMTLGYSTSAKDAAQLSEVSDLDVVILYDSSKDPRAREKLHRIASGEHDIFRRKYATRVTPPLAIASMHDINLERIRWYLREKPPSTNLDALNVIQGLIALTSLAVGPGVDTYRRLIGDEIRRMPPREADDVLHRIGGILALLETTDLPRAGPSKMVTRMLPREPSETIDALTNSRVKQWIDGAILVFGLN